MPQKTRKSWKCRAEMPDFRTVPEHVAIIMDGNGRWAKKNNVGRLAGHNAGIPSKIGRASCRERV